ncbi:hypothetical protein ACFQMF_14870 [Halorubrum rutilum]|uniref:Uncharacterized protein n=1 Tax=Halorubrum rutilum TaxID=1364933 RepID=A0ABD6ANL4_9EURY|nr:hypothetical protein [Halorubrum rutilum]
MQRTRRDLLAGVGVAAGFAGCLGVDGVTYPDEPDSEGDADGGTAPDGSDGDGSDGDGSDDDGSDDDGRSGPNPALAAATRGVVGDALWFATSYEAAIRVYREATADVLADVDAVRESVREATDPTVGMAERLEAAGYDAAERAAAALEPHFYPAGLLRSRTDRHVPVLDRFARRNDADRFAEELERMRLSFFQIRTPIYVGRRFSRDPIHNRLLDRLAPGDPDGVVVELAVPERRRFATLAHRPYPDGDDEDDGETYPPTFTDDALPAARRESLRERLGPVVRPDGRTAELFFTFADRPEPADRRGDAFRGPPSELDGAPLHVQRYADAETASDRLADALAAGATEGREPISPATEAADDAVEWHRYYHREVGSDRTDLGEFAGVQYGYLLQAGEFVLATGFSGDAWEERPRWQGRLPDAWVAA